MKKFYSRSLIAFHSSCNKDRIKALKIFFLALALSCFGYSGFAQVVVTPAHDTGICAQTATNGSTPGCTTLGIITINETLNSDFALGANQIVLNPPSGWQFCVAPPPVITASGGGDISAVSFTITSSGLTINTTTSGTLLLDMLTITGLQVQPVLTSSSIGDIIASSVTGITGITSGSGGTSFGRVGLVPTPVLGPNSVCVGSCITLTSSPGVVWTSSNPALATVTPLGGDSVRVCGVSAAASVTITATDGACFQTKAVAVNPLPTSMVITDSTLCAWYDSTSVTSLPGTGLYFSTGVTTYNLGGGLGRIRANAPGIFPVTYTLPTSCSITKYVTVNANPYPIMPADLTSPYFELCDGSTRLYTCDTGGGTWATVTGSVATVTTVGGGDGSVLGVSPGTTKLVYIAPTTGCRTDTTITVRPLPTPITGDTAICEGQTTTLASGPCGGTWSVVTGTVALKVAENACADTAVFLGIGAGTTVILYTLSTGCAQITSLTVNPLPGGITGTSVVCEGDSVLLSSSSGGGTWVSSDITIATIDTATGWLKGVDSGVVTIVYTLPTGCLTTYSVTVNPLPTIIAPIDSVCEGSSITLTGLPSGGTWASSLPGIAIVDGAGVVTGIAYGVTTITYTLPTGCFVTKDITVNPTPGPIFGPDRVCVGNTITLSNSTSGGIWTSLDSFTLRIDTTTGIAIGVAPSPFGTTIRYTVGACFASYVVTVDPVPPPISGPLTVCMFDTATYTNSLGGGVWSSADTLLATIDSFTGLLTGVAAGTVFITYTTLGDCFATYSVIIHPNALIDGKNLVCQGDTIHLSSTIPTGFWTNTGTGITSIAATGGNAIITGVSPGVDTITYITADGCISKKIVTVAPFAPISILDSTICLGATDSVWNVVPGGVWNSSNPAKLFVSSTGFITTLDTGVVIISYTTPAGCIATISVTVNPNPSTITGDSVVCMGQMITLSNIDTGGIWTSNNNAIATVGTGNGIVTGVTAGTTTITYAFPTTCYTTKAITVHPLSPIFGDSILCVGDTVTLMDTTTGGYFSISPGIYATIDSFGKTIALSGYGVEIVYYTLPTGCQASLQITVNPLPSPIVGRDSVCQADTIMLSTADSFGVWSTRFGLTSVDTAGVVTGITVGIDSIYYTLPTGCRIGKPVVVNLTPAPIVGPSQVCIGRYISLSNPTPGGYWTSQGTSVASVTTGGVVNGLAIDTTSIYYTLPVGSCRAALVVTVQPIPVIAVTPNPSPIKCKYATVVLTATGAVSTGTTLGSYSWTPSYGLNVTGSAVVLASPTITTTYTVTGINPATGCDSFTTVTVLVDDSLNNMKIVGDSSICDGECTILMASGRAGTFYNWHPSVGLSCTICDTVRACPTTSTTYWAVAIDDLGCKDSVSFRVNVHPIPVIRVNPSPAVVCRGRPLQLWATSLNTDTTTNTYTWKPNLFISCDTCNNPIINDTANIVYRVIGTTIHGCYDSFDVKVSVLDTNLNTISNDTNICIGDAALLIATSKSLVSNLDVPKFTWLPNDGSLSHPDSSATLAFPTATRTYSVAIRANACFSDTLSVTVFVEKYPQVEIKANATTNIVAGSPIQLTVSPLDVAVRHYSWAPANTLSCDSCFNPVATPVVNTTYTVTVTSIYGCTSTDTITLNLYCDREQVFIPNTFTPNGDGVNDRFYVSGKGIRIINLFQVYNRWGQLVYEQRNIQANDPANGWDATFKGLVLPPDVFTYIVKAQCDLSTETYTYTGDVSIVR